MAKFTKAYSISLKTELTPDEYNTYDNKNFLNDLECTTCKKFTSYPAKLHLRYRDEYFFATNPKSEHHQDCKHYSQFTSKVLVDIIEKDNGTEEDILELNILIEQKKKYLLKHMYPSKDEELEINNQELNNDKQVSGIKRIQGIKSNKTTKYIEQKHIKYISSKDDDCFDRPLAVYGEVVVTIETSVYNNTYSNKIVSLSYDNKIRLSIYIQENIANELKLDDGEYEMFFVGIGKITLKDKKYFNFNFYNKKDFLEFKLIKNI